MQIRIIWDNCFRLPYVFFRSQRDTTLGQNQFRASSPQLPAEVFIIPLTLSRHGYRQKTRDCENEHSARSWWCNVGHKAREPPQFCKSVEVDQGFAGRLFCKPLSRLGLSKRRTINSATDAAEKLQGCFLSRRGT